MKVAALLACGAIAVAGLICYSQYWNEVQAAKELRDSAEQADPCMFHHRFGTLHDGMWRADAIEAMGGGVEEVSRTTIGDTEYEMIRFRCPHGPSMVVLDLQDSRIVIKTILEAPPR